MRPSSSLVVLSLCAATSACIGDDHALTLGSVAFHLHASQITREGLPSSAVVDGWSIVVDRALLSFKTVTIGQTDDPNKCSYRGRAAASNVVFDPRLGVVQTFNGLLPTTCPDVGIVFGAPDDATVPGAGATPADLVDLVVPSPAHAIVEMTAQQDDRVYKVKLRFITALTSSTFGGCRTGTRGVLVPADDRLDVSMAFTFDAFFRESLSTSATVRFEPYVLADRNGDQVVTMDELDALDLSTVQLTYPGAYQLTSSNLFGGTMGDFVRGLFKYTFFYGEDGSCTGNDPGVQ